MVISLFKRNKDRRVFSADGLKKSRKDSSFYKLLMVPNWRCHLENNNYYWKYFCEDVKVEEELDFNTDFPIKTVL